MKVLIISDAWHPQVNGVVRTYEHIGAELEKAGYIIHVIGPSDFPLCLPMPGYAEIKLALFPYHTLEKMIDEWRPNSIHIATEGPLGWAARRYCLKHGHSFTTSFHTHFPDYATKRLGIFAPLLHKTVYALARHYVRIFHAPASVLMVATKSLEDELESWGFKTPMHRVTRGANFDQFFPGEKKLFHDLPKPVALYVGRVAVEKNIEDFLTMPWKGSKVIVGEGPSLKTLEKKYPGTIFTGKKTGADLADHYRSADVFVFPSRTDTFGMVLVEALACGLPVAGYNATGPRDIITENFLGAIDDTNLSAAAEKALQKGTPEQRAAHVKDYYTWQNATHQFIEAMNRAL